MSIERPSFHPRSNEEQDPFAVIDEEFLQKLGVLATETDKEHKRNKIRQQGEDIKDRIRMMDPGALRQVQEQLGSLDIDSLDTSRRQGLIRLRKWISNLISVKEQRNESNTP